MRDRRVEAAGLLAGGIDVVRLETGVRRPRALELHKGRGYVRISRFGDRRGEPLNAFLQKRLA
ncbi:MAG: hypothetical protein OXC08_04760 [Thiotrichales bacterium]|nr:hypothetical protein [Thiotrichales bacterium]